MLSSLRNRSEIPVVPNGEVVQLGQSDVCVMFHWSVLSLCEMICFMRPPIVQKNKFFTLGLPQYCILCSELKSFSAGICSEQTSSIYKVL